MYKNIDFFKFQKLLSSEKKCQNYLFHGWWPNGFVCPKCQGGHYSYVSTRGLYQCTDCRYQCSLKVGTVFQKSKTPLQKWFWMIFLLSQNKNGYSALALKKLLSISYGTALSMSYKIRTAMQARDANYQLSGLIELDDAYFGGKRASGKRGRGSDKKTLVMVGVQLNENEKPQYTRMTTVDNLTEQNVKNVTKEQIKEGSEIKSDAYSSYKVLEKYGYIHKPTKIGIPENTSKFLPWVHIMISNAKAIFQGTYHGVSTKHLPKYLAEFCYRFNRRFQQNQLFDRLTWACICAQPITVAELSE